MNISDPVRQSLVSLGVATLVVTVSVPSSLRGQAGDFGYQEWFNLHYAGASSSTAAVSSVPATDFPVWEDDDGTFTDAELEELLQQWDGGEDPWAVPVTSSAASSAAPSSWTSDWDTGTEPSWDEIFGDTASVSSAAGTPWETAWPEAPIADPVVPVAERSCSFTDLLPGTLEQNAALWLCDRGVVTGIAAGRMAPGETLNRAQAAMIIVRALELQPGVRTGVSFPDVPPDAWYAPAVSAAQTHGIVTGYDDGTFKPERPVGRAELAAMVVRAFNLSVDGTHMAAPIIPLDARTGQWYDAPVKTALAHQLFPGDPERFSPLKVANRSSAIIAIYQAMQATGRE